jgi:hypothetical protein
MALGGYPLKKLAQSRAFVPYEALTGSLEDHDQFFEGEVDASSLLPLLVEHGVVTAKQEQTIRDKLKSGMHREANRKLHFYIIKQKKKETSDEHKVRLQNFLDALHTTEEIPGHRGLHESIHKNITKYTLKPDTGSHLSECSQGICTHSTADEPTSHLFTNSGGSLHCLCHGVSIHVPAGAIAPGESVRILLRNVTEGEVLHRLSSFYANSILCSQVFEFEAKRFCGGEEVNFITFRRDIWIEMPHCAHIPSASSAHMLCVLSERSGIVEPVPEALFSPGYPYVNFPTCHFTRYTISLQQPRKFIPAYPRRSAEAMSSRQAGLSKKISASDRKGGSPRLMHSALSSQPVRKVPGQHPQPPSFSPALSSTQSESSAPLSQQAVQKQRDELVTGNESLNHLTSAFSQNKLEEEPSLNLVMCLLQPKNRSREQNWEAHIVFLQFLPNVLEILKECSVGRDSHMRVFRLLPPSNSIRLAHPSPATPGWTVDLGPLEISLESVLAASIHSSQMLDSLPKSTATVTHHGAGEGLSHGVTVEHSCPIADCFITSDIPPRDGEGHVSQGGPTVIDWTDDCLLLAVLSLLLPDSELSTLGRTMGLSDGLIDQIQLLDYSEVGEKMYQMFVAGDQRHLLNNFGQLLIVISESSISQQPLACVHSYLTELKPLCRGGNRFSVEQFLEWALRYLGSGGLDESVLRCGENLYLFEHQSTFVKLSDCLTRFWPMFGRLCGLSDQTVHQISSDYPLNRRGATKERCQQTLRGLCQEFPRLSFKTMLMALDVISVHAAAGTNAAYWYTIRYVNQQQ